jgi:glucan phosphoethanolaminetransferase (alkaline phosphatase superfamily)
LEEVQMESTLGTILIIGAIALIAWALFKRLFRIAIIAVVVVALGAWLLLS